MNNYEVHVTIKPGPIEIIDNNSLPSRASIYFVAIAFLIVLVVTIIWLAVYYVQKYRYYNAKKRLDVRLEVILECEFFFILRFFFVFQIEPT